MLDSLNPRFGSEKSDLTQNQIKEKLLTPKGSKELLNSMKENIKWISKIVVRDVKDLSKEELKNYSQEIFNYKYIVIEGNTRMACLKSGNIPYVEESMEIPVLLTVKEPNESHSHYLKELKITQGISNVMVVKEWGDIAKAKHLYELYIAKNREDTNSTFPKIVNSISKELGMSSVDVRKSIYRYAFYNEINTISDTLPGKHWGYLEALDKNIEIRKFMGLKDGSLDFEWTENTDEYQTSFIQEDNEYTSLKKELLVEIPSIIKVAETDGLNTKEFRDLFISLVKERKESDLEDFKEFLTNTTNFSERKENWRTLYERFKNGNESLEEEWKMKFEDMKNNISNLPLNSQWVVNYKSLLQEIQECISDSIEILEFKEQKKLNKNHA